MILVTGASGTVGSAVVEHLRARGAAVVAADRKARPVEGARAVRLDFTDRSTWGPAVEGCERLFLVRPPAISAVRETLVPFVDFARARGVGHVVFLSVAGAGRTRLVPHRAVEDHLRENGPRWTSLRPGFFAQNLETAYRDDIVLRDRIYLPAGHAPVNWIDARDIGEAAAAVLVAPAAHEAQAYTLAGPGPVPWSVVTDALTEVLGRPIRYVPASVAGYAFGLARAGRPASAIAVQTALHVLLRFGQGAGEDPWLAQVLDRRPRDVVTYIREHAARWAR